MKRSRRIRARLREGLATPRETADMARGYQRSSFWQLIADIAEAEDKAITGENTMKLSGPSSTERRVTMDG